MAEEVANHTGGWPDVISLRREDTERLGYDSVSQWKELQRSRVQLIAVNEETSEIFKDFSEGYPEYMTYVEHKAFIGITEIAEFIVSITSELLAALSAYFVAKIQYA